MTAQLIDGCEYVAAWRTKRQEAKALRARALEVTPPSSGGAAAWGVVLIVGAVLGAITWLRF